MKNWRTIEKVLVLTFLMIFFFWSTENTKIQLLSKSESIGTINTVFNKKTKKNNRKMENKRKIFIFKFFRDFIFLIDRKHQKTPADQISASLNKKYSFYTQTKENNKKEQRKECFVYKSRISASKWLKFVQKLYCDALYQTNK